MLPFGDGPQKGREISKGTEKLSPPPLEPVDPSEPDLENFQEVLPTFFDDKGEQKETAEKIEKEISLARELLESLDLDEEVLPYIEEVIARRGFAYIVGQNIKSERLQSLIEEVISREEYPLLESEFGEAGKYIPVGALNTKYGLLVLHQEIDLVNKSLLNKFYFTRSVLREGFRGKFHNVITNMKFELNSERDLTPEEKMKVIIRTGRGANETLVHCEMPSQLHNNIKEFVNTVKPSPYLLSGAYALIKKGKKIGEEKF